MAGVIVPVLGPACLVYVIISLFGAVVRDHGRHPCQLSGTDARSIEQESEETFNMKTTSAKTVSNAPAIYFVIRTCRRT